MRRTFWAEYGDSPENKEYFCTRKRAPVLRRRDARVAEEARLESVYTPKAYRGFESPSLR